jgi:hypothetical protein
MLVPNASVGAIIGKGGSTINEMSAQCGAQMKAPPVKAPQPLPMAHTTFGAGVQQGCAGGAWPYGTHGERDRGPLADEHRREPRGVQDAGESGRRRVPEHDHPVRYPCTAHPPFVIPGPASPSGVTPCIAGMGLACLAPGSLCLFQVGASPWLVRSLRSHLCPASLPCRAHLCPGCEVTISVLDSLAGFVVGKEGATLREIQRQSGARITMSRRGECVRLPPPSPVAHVAMVWGALTMPRLADMFLAPQPGL